MGRLYLFLGGIYALCNLYNDYPSSPGSHYSRAFYFNVERGAASMAKMGEILRRKQPEIYRQIMFMYPSEKKEPDEEQSFREVANLMRHDAYVRDHGAVRQVRRG